MKQGHKKLPLGIWLLAIVGIATLALGLFFMQKKEAKPTNLAQNETAVSVSSSTSTEPSSSSAATGTTIIASDSAFGPMLYNEKKQAIYIWQLEESSTPECYGDCAVQWPPVLTNGTPIASSGVNGKLLGTTQRTDGSTQVTYNGHPLYYYAHENPGEVKCHNIKTHGGLWWVIQPSGVRAP